MWEVAIDHSILDHRLVGPVSEMVSVYYLNTSSIYDHLQLCTELVLVGGLDEGSRRPGEL